MKFLCHPEVADAIAESRPVVALESTVIAHGLPYPENLRVAQEMEDTLRQAHVVPATVAVLDGVVRVGLEASDLGRLAEDKSITKASIRDLGPLMARGQSGATTVATTAFLAARAGIRTFVTGGIGGVHRWAADVSADLHVLANTEMVVVSAGIKSILDIAATLELLETLGVPVIGYRTDRMPGFYLTRTEHAVSARAESAEEIAEIARCTWELGLGRGLLVANPIPERDALNPLEHDALLEAALSAATAQGISGAAMTPFLLSKMASASAGKSVAANKSLLLANARLGAAIAQAMVRV